MNNNAPKYLVDCAKYRLTDQFRDYDPEWFEKKLQNCRNDIRDKIKQYREYQQQLHDALHTKNELINWLKSIGEYEESKTETPETN